MTVSKTNIDGVLIIEPRVFGDARGYFFESYNARDFREQTGIEVSFVQDNESRSSRGVVRGLHFQEPPFAQAKVFSLKRAVTISLLTGLIGILNT